MLNTSYTLLLLLTSCRWGFWKGTENVCWEPLFKFSSIDLSTQMFCFTSVGTVIWKVYFYAFLSFWKNQWGCQASPLLRDNGFTQMWIEDWAGEKILPKLIINMQLLSQQMKWLVNFHSSCLAFQKKGCIFWHNYGQRCNLSNFILFFFSFDIAPIKDQFVLACECY